MGFLSIKSFGIKFHLSLILNTLSQQAVEVERLAAGAQAATFAPPDSPWC
jgi:hypothetical protein